MASKCPKCDKTVYFAEKVTSLGKDWHKFCLKCERCNKTLNPGGHAEHDGTPYCHKPCYAALFGPKGVNIGGAGSYVYEAPANNTTTSVSMETEAKPEEKKAHARGPVKAASFSTFSGEPSKCPRCSKTVYFAEKVTSLGKDWHRPCLRCERCSKTLAPGSHAEVRQRWEEQRAGSVEKGLGRCPARPLCDDMKQSPINRIKPQPLGLTQNIDWEWSPLYWPSTCSHTQNLDKGIHK
uniref:Cysteine-rich protein 2 n=1 Tax=Esox lucius TaxID=8010 RepID=A0AAY5K9C3_ESOLU